MKWVAIAGTWNTTDSQIEADVRATVRRIIDEGNGIVSGGALGVDYFATDEALKTDKNGTHIKVLLPSALELFSFHYRKRATEGVITTEQAENLIQQLTLLKSRNPDALIEGTATELKRETYFDRITHIVEASDELYAFQVNGSEGTQDTINKAKVKGIPVTVFPYISESFAPKAI